MGIKNRYLPQGAGTSVEEICEELIQSIKKRDESEPEFMQAFSEVLYSIKPVLKKNPEYAGVLKQIAEPERVIMFRVAWVDDNGKLQVNRGYRVQYSSALGPYKGGIRFHPTVTLSVMKFLAFEQIFKNALTDLGMGGGKGGSDFDPKGKSDREILAFCQSFMCELHKHIGICRDVPAGDINVGVREIGYMFGQYKRLERQTDGALTGKGIGWGGSKIRIEATGYGLVYFLQNWAEENQHPIRGSACVISGAGNVALYAAMKLCELEARVIGISDTTGYAYTTKGFDMDQIQNMIVVKQEKKSLKEFCDLFKSVEWHANQNVWELKNYSIALPCAKENEIDHEVALKMSSACCRVVAEGANMPCTPGAVDTFRKYNIGFLPAKAANAGGVVVSGLEMIQNSSRSPWSAEAVDSKLKSIMNKIYETCSLTAEKWGAKGDLLLGANIAGFLRVAEAVQAQGAV